MGKIAASYGYNYVEAYIDVFVVYIIVCTLAQIGFQLCERHFGRYRQSAQSVGKQKSMLGFRPFILYCMSGLFLYSSIMVNSRYFCIVLLALVSY